MPQSKPLISRKITLVVSGETEESFEDALETATRLINRGYTSGMDRNPGHSGFYFDSVDGSRLANCELPRVD